MLSFPNRLLYYSATGFLWGLTCLPRRLAYWVGTRLGDLLYILLGTRRRVTLQNLALAFRDDKTATEQQRIARATFRRLGQHVIDFSTLRDLSPARFQACCQIEGLAHVEHLVARRRGLLIVSAHFGSWELAPALALRLSTPLHVIVRPLDNPALHLLTERYRQRCGYHAIPRRHALAASLQALRRGEIVALLMDQSSLRSEGIEVEFFGTKTYTSLAPALLALRTGCPVISAFLVQEAPGHHRLVLSQEILLPRTGRLRHDLAVHTQALNQIIETYVRRYPEQWFWLHRRWKQRPPAAESLAVHSPRD